MLKATFKGYYRKKGSSNPIFVYTVIGTAKELVEYATAKANSQGISLEDYNAKRLANGGQYLHHITPNLAKGIGIPDEKTMWLSITPNGTVVVDDTAKVLRQLHEDEMEIRAARNKTIGEGQARIALGLDKPSGATFTATPAPVVKEQLDVKADDQPDDLDTANAELQGAVAGTLENE